MANKLKSPFPKYVYERNSEIYKLMANPKRLEILNIIKNTEASVDQLSEIIGIRKANTSQHLSILRHLRIVNVRKEGKNSYYKLVNPELIAPCAILMKLWNK
ncbi:MAG TPA: metalloregulator ArsR/SmtB family transcription factor [Patescibacteria group bacterium]|nr:metalloregulator ArsR/SmtB family transcription factor [Patescibacteria group bacterium]